MTLDIWTSNFGAIAALTIVTLLSYVFFFSSYASLATPRRGSATNTTGTPETSKPAEITPPDQVARQSPVNDPSFNETEHPKKVLESEDYTVGLITVLAIELAAAKAALDEQHEEPSDFEQQQSDDNIYTWGRIGKHNVVIAAFESGVYGVASAAITANSMVTSIPSLRIGLLVGIGGGVPAPERGRDIRLGDVAVSDPKGTSGGVVQYDLGKRTTHTFERVGFLAKPPAVLLKAVTTVKSDYMAGKSNLSRIIVDLQSRMSKADPSFAYQGQENDRLFKASFDHQGRADCTECEKAGAKHLVKRSVRPSVVPNVHYGLIASGNTVMKNAKERDELVTALNEKTGGECICLEMEAAGLMNAFPCLVIRGISDYADSHKNDGWQKYAAMAAAAYAKELLGVVPVRQVKNTKKAIESLQSS